MFIRELDGCPCATSDAKSQMNATCEARNRSCRHFRINFRKFFKHFLNSSEFVGDDGLRSTGGGSEKQTPSG